MAKEEQAKVLSRSYFVLMITVFSFMSMDPGRIFAASTISGTISGNNSEIICVSAIQQTDGGTTGCEVDWENSVGTGSAADGTYSFTVDDGEYYLYFAPCADPATTFLGEKYWTSDSQGTSNCDSAEIFDSITKTDSKDVVLEPGGRITGTLTGTNDQEVCVNAQKLIDGGQNGCDTEWVAVGMAGAGGTFSFSAPPGEYYLSVHVDCRGSNANNLLFTHWTSDGEGTTDCSQAETFSLAPNEETTKNMTIEQGGFISGTVTTEPPVTNWDNFTIEVRSENGDWVTDDPVNPGGSYTTGLIPAGDYLVHFQDNGGQFQDEWYDQAPWAWEGATSITVSPNTTTPNINVTLKEPSDDRYYPGWANIGTSHMYNNDGTLIKTSSGGIIQLQRFSDGKLAVKGINESSLTITTPSGVCTNDSYAAEIFWRIQLLDNNHNGIIEDGERSDPHAPSYVERHCTFGDTPHAAGDYTFNVTLPNASVVTKTLTDRPAGLTPSQLPPVTGLTVSWNDEDKEMDLSWSLPSTAYPPETYIGMRVLFYKNGHYLNNQIRVRGLPATLSSFTLGSDVAAFLDTGNVDQLLIRVALYENTYNTVTRTIQTYSFNSATGALTKAPITMKLLDVNGNGQTGLEEVIYSLQAVSGN